MQTQNEFPPSPLLATMNLEEIRYSMVWEDPQLLSAALQVHSDDQVLSIGSAGCNALHLLLSQPVSVTALDLSPSQSALLRLKKLAIETLPFEDFMALMGLADNRRAGPLYLSLRPALPQSDRFYFDQRPFLFDRGLSFQGRLESYFAYFRENGLSRIWKSDFLKALLRAKTIEEQNDLLEEHGYLEALGSLVVQFFGREGLTRGRSEAQMLYVERENIGEKLYSQFLEKLHQSLIRENHFLHLFLLGKMPAEKFRPPIYQAANYCHLQSQIHKLEIINSDIESFLAHSSRKFSKFNLSDIFEYLSPEHTQSLFRQIATHMPVGGRLAYWTLLVDRRPPPLFQSIECTTLPPDRLWFYDQFYALEKTWIS